MPAPKRIPPELTEPILRQAGKGKTGAEIAAWLRAEHGIKVSDRAIRGVLKRVRDERGPAAKAVAVAKLAKTVTSDLDALDSIIERARKDEEFAGKTKDIEAELERLAMFDIGDCFDEKGALKPLHEMTEDARRCISAIEVEQVTVSGAADDGEFSNTAGRVVKVKFHDKLRSLVELLTKIRQAHPGRELAIKARDQQLKARALRLELAGAGGKPDDDPAQVRKRLETKLEAFASED